LEERHRRFRNEEEEQEQEEEEEARRMCNWTVKAAATSGEAQKKKISLLPRKRWPRMWRLLASVSKSHAREGDEHDH
jgi:hypothetical protein